MAVERSVVSWDGNAINDGTNYTAVMIGASGLPGVEVRWAQRLARWPRIASVGRPGRKVSLGVTIEGSAPDTLRTQLYQWFSPEGETKKALVVEDADGSNDRYVMAICEALDPVPDGGGRMFVATLALDDDVRWLATATTTAVWAITASGDSVVVNNPGREEAYPVYTLTPTAAKSSDSYTYRQFWPWRWRASEGAIRYPLDICDGGLDTATLVTAGKMQADGDDLRAEIDGVEVDRWLDGMNGANTRVWANVDFEPAWASTLAAAIGAGDSVTSITASGSTAGAPAAGILVVNAEVFTYTSKNDSTKTFGGVTRAAHGSSAGNHAAGDAVWWCQHEIYIKYGNASAAAPSADDDYKPAFELDHSTNTSWVYESFGEDDGQRAGQWQAVVSNGTPTFYGGNQASEADPWTDAGLSCANAKGRYRLINPCGITNVAVTNGEKYATNLAHFTNNATISSWTGTYWQGEYYIPAPGTASTWEAWSRSEAIASGRKQVSIMCRSYSKSKTNRVEFADVTITLNSSYTPAGFACAEQSAYVFACTLENETTGDEIELALVGDLNQAIEIDTANKTVTAADGSNQFQALTLAGGPRRDWLPLDPGDNTLTFTDTGTAGLTVTVEFVARYF